MHIKIVGFLLAVNLLVSESKAIETLNFIAGVGCFIGTVYAGFECYKAFEKATKGDEKIVVKNKTTTLAKFRKKLNKNRNSSVGEELYYVRMRYGSSFAWGLATVGLCFVGGTLWKESFKEQLSVNLAARLTASPGILN